MKAPIFPIFSLKTYKNYVVVSGGGGNQDFGKKNGIVILDETTYKDIAYYETEDIILGLYISEGEIELEEDDLRWNEQDTSEESTNENTNANDTNTINANNTNTINANDTNTINANDTNTTNANTNLVYIGCRGTNNIYILKFEDNKINLVTKIEKSVDKLVFKRHVIVLENKKILTAYDVIQNPKSMSALLNKKSPSNIDSHEEYIYALKKSGEKILIEREEGKTDVPDTWTNFFVVQNRIHKVTHENKGYSFVFDGKRYFFEREIGDIAYLHNNDETLIFYLKGNDSTLKFLGQNEISFEIQKITCMNVDNGEFICVGTADGKGYLFKNRNIYCVKKLCDVPITGISYKNGYFYYSSFNGLVSRKKAFSLVRILLFIGVVLALLIAVIYNIYKKKEDYMKGGDIIV